MQAPASVQKEAEVIGHYPRTVEYVCQSRPLGSRWMRTLQRLIELLWIPQKDKVLRAE